MRKIQDITIITNEDYVGIVSTYHKITDVELDCSSCLKKYSGERNIKHRKRKGCEELLKDPWLQFKGEFGLRNHPKINYYTCPSNLYDGEWAGLIDLYEWWQKGVMPYSGSLIEQPNKIVEVMNLVHNLIEEDRQKKERVAKQFNNRRPNDKRS